MSQYGCKKAALFTVLLVTLLVACSAPAAAYPGFYYHITDQTDELWISQDGSIWLEKTFTFHVESHSQYTGTEIWVGIPYEAYCQYVKDENGRNIDWWYVNDGYGVAIGEGDFEILQGTGQTFTMYFDVREFLHLDTENESYVVMQYMPGWWGDDDTDSGTVDRAMIMVHLPASVPTEELRTFADSEYDWYNESNGTAVWNFYDVQPGEQVGMGIGFPLDYVQPAYTLYSQGVTDWGDFDFIWEIIGFLFVGAFYLFFSGAIIYGIVSAVRGKYHPPKVKMEGVGVNYKLDAVEAAVLLKRPPTSILTIVLFGLLRSGNLRVLSGEPLKLDVISRQGLSTYERGFVNSIRKSGTIDEKKLKNAFRALVSRVVDRTRAYDRKKTEDFYRKKVEETWEIVTTVETPYDENLLWLMADEKFEKKSTDAFSGDIGGSTVTYPTWYDRMPPDVVVHGPSTTVSSGAPVPSGLKPPMPSGTGAPAPPGTAGGGPLGALQGFAQSVCEGVNSTAQGIVSNVQGFAQTFTETFSDPTPTTTPRARSGRSRSSSSSRSSCACACACVSCACACACAGGGGCT